MQKGLVTVICVNWNGEKSVEKTINSILGQTYTPLEIIIIDNNSSDDSVKIIKERYPQVQLIEHDKNLGWPAGLNAGISISDGEYIVPLNNDLWMEKRCIEEMVKSVNKNSRYGSCAPKIYLDKDKHIVEAAGVGVYVDGSSYARGRLQSEEMFEKKEEVFCASDCCCLYKREMLNDIGLYDERFFLYAEETEMGWRYQLAGWKCIYTPTAIAFHEHSASSRGYSLLKAYHVERNRIWVAVRYYPMTILLFKVPWFSIYRYLYQIILCAVSKRGSLAQFRETHSLFSCLKVLIRAHWSAFLHIPYYLKKRLVTPKRISNEEIKDIFRKYGCSTREMASYE